MHKVVGVAAVCASCILYGGVRDRDELLNQAETEAEKYRLNLNLNMDKQNKGGLTTRFDPPPNGLRELKLHRSSTNMCTKTKMF